TSASAPLLAVWSPPRDRRSRECSPASSSRSARPAPAAGGSYPPDSRTASATALLLPAPSPAPLVARVANAQAPACAPRSVIHPCHAPKLALNRLPVPNSDLIEATICEIGRQLAFCADYAYLT